jgi:arsenite-transporting ATPase
MNRWLPEEAAAEPFFADWVRVQRERLVEVEQSFAPLPVLRAPLGETEVSGNDALVAHGGRIFADVEPDARLSVAPRVRYQREGSRYVAVVPLPHGDPKHLDVAKVDDELTITTDTRRRSFKLPRRFAPLELQSARIDGATMRVEFGRQSPPSKAV